MSYPNADISFPGLFGDWRFTLSPKLLDIGNGIYWYGVLIAAGLLIALWFCMKRAPRWMQKAKLEWLFRGMLQPKRAGRLMALPKFVLKVHHAKK